MNDLKDARMRNLYYGLIGALVVAGAIIVGCANSADASERHHPQPRPAVKQNVTAKPTANARSESGGNSLSTDGDKVDVAPTVAFSEGDMPDLMPMIGDGCTATDMEVFKGLLFGYAHSTATVTPECEARMLVPLYGKWFSTPDVGNPPYEMENGVAVKYYSDETRMTAKIGRGFACTRDSEMLSNAGISCP